MDHKFRVATAEELREFTLPPAARLKLIAKRREVDYRTPPFSPGDPREFLRLNLLAALQAESSTPLDRARPEAIAAAMTIWNTKRPKATPASYELSAKIGRTVFAWRSERPARGVEAWIRRGMIHERLLAIIRGGSSANARKALAYVLWEFRHELVTPASLRSASRETIVARFPQKFASVGAFRHSVERVRNYVS